VPRTIHSILTGAFIALATATSAFAQRAPVRSAIENYDRGRKAVEQKKWDDAITALTAAVAQDAQDRTYREGAFNNNYFPHHFLFIAYVEKGETAKAREALALRGPLPNDLLQQENPYMARLNSPGAAPGGVPGGTPAGGTPAVVAPAAPAADTRALAPYNAGIAAMKANQWQNAINSFNAAVRIDAEDKPRSDNPDGYFPHYYIAIANLLLGKLDEASANFDKRGAVGRTIYLADEEGKFTKEVDFSRNTAAADDASAKQNLQAAIDGWQKACGLLPDECNNRGLNQKIADAKAAQSRIAAANAVAQHVASAKSLMGENDLDGARREFQAALNSDSNNAEATAGIKDIQAREQTYSNSKAAAEQAVKANDLNAASRSYAAALAAHPRWYHDRDKLDTVVTALNQKRMDAQGIETLAAEAQTAFKDGRYDAAKQAAETVLAKNPNYGDMKSIVSRSESRILFEDGRKIAAAGDYLQADTKYKNALNRDPANDFAAKALQASVTYQGFVGQKLWTQARNADKIRFDRERPDQNFDIIDAIKAANVSFEDADYGSARKKIDEVVQRDPRNITALALQRRIMTVVNAAKTADRAVAPAQPTATQTEAPLLPMWMWAAIATVTLVGAGTLLMVRGRTPTPVAIDSLPWGRVSIQQHGKPAKAAPSEKTTPFLISLPPGQYELHVSSESMSQPYTTTVTVVRGQQNKVVVTNPAYDVDEIVSSLLG